MQNETQVSNGRKKLYGAINRDDRVVDVSHSERALRRRYEGYRIAQVRETRRTSTHAYYLEIGK